jgi:Fic family protein
MKIPTQPPQFKALLEAPGGPERINRILSGAARRQLPRKYLHWDKLRHLKAPNGWSHEDLWLALKMQRFAAAKSIPLRDKNGQQFNYCVPDAVAEQLHEIDVGAGGTIGMPEQITNPQTRDQYVVRSLMEEAITSSQLEGAVTTRKIAKEMIRTGRAPKDRSERMILNNFRTMRKIIEIRDQPLTRDLIFDIHRLVTEGALDDESAAGRFRRADERITVQDEHGEIFHDPPPAEDLDQRLTMMCSFGNGETPTHFVHPVLRAIILHFWLAYDHPFVDGNGRTARALFYWAMLRNRYWLFEFISISEILVRAPAKYARSFLYTETDSNDLTYFIIYQTEVIKRAVEGLHVYIKKKAEQLRQTEALLRHSGNLNHRQEALLGHALRHPDTRYTIEGHRLSHSIAYDTARNDLLQLHKLELLNVRKSGKALIFYAAPDLADKISTAARPVGLAVHA